MCSTKDLASVEVLIKYLDNETTPELVEALEHLFASYNLDESLLSVRMRDVLRERKRRKQRYDYCDPERECYLSAMSWIDF